MMGLTAGNHVQLTDGRIGKIVLVHPNDPLRPLKLDDCYTDDPELKIDQSIV